MKKQLSLAFCVLIFNFLCFVTVFAQTSQSVSDENLAKKKAIAFYENAIKLQSRIFNGPTYYTYANNVGGSAIFLDTTFLKGSIVYEGIKYNDVPLMYDLYIDKLVSIKEDRDAYSLITEKVQAFEINSHHFEYFNFEDLTAKNDLQPGFFEVLYDGKIKVIAKHIEKLSFSTSLDRPYYFKPQTSYFLVKDDQYFKFNDDKSLISLLNKNKKEMKKQLQDVNIKFNVNPTEVINVIAKYYDSLAN